MPLSANKYLPYLILLLLAVPLFFINIRDVHSWGDDFAQYIREAQNIAYGKPFYRSGYIYNYHNPEYAPPQYPAGFPLLLAPIVKMWGLSIRAMCYFNSVIATCLLFALFAFFRKYAGVVAAICLSVLITYNGYMIDLKANVLSDVPCLLFVTLYLALRNATDFSWKRIVLLTLVISMAILIRSQAILLLLAEGILFLYSAIRAIIKEKRASSSILSPSLYVVLGGILLTWLLNNIIFAAPVNTASFYTNFINMAGRHSLVDTANDNISLLVSNLSAFFFYETNNGFYKAAITVIESMGLVFTIVGFIITIRRRVAIDHIFLLLMCLLVIYLPYHDQRYFLPVLPILFYYCYVAISTLLPHLSSVNPRLVAIVFTLVYLRFGYAFLKKSATEVPPGCVLMEKDKIAMQYITTHISDSDIIVFTKPRLLTLYTNKRSVNIAWQLTAGENKKYFDSLDVKYMLVVDGLYDYYFKPYLAEAGHPKDSVRIADGYTLYTLR